MYDVARQKHLYDIGGYKGMTSDGDGMHVHIEGFCSIMMGNSPNRRAGKF